MVCWQSALGAGAAPPGSLVNRLPVDHLPEDGILIYYRPQAVLQAYYA